MKARILTDDIFECWNTACMGEAGRSQCVRSASRRPADISADTCHDGTRAIPAPPMAAETTASRLLAHKRPCTLTLMLPLGDLNCHSMGPSVSENTRQSC